MSRINTNIPSIQAVHRLAANQGDLTIRMERLSTGLRINRGRDDPAGLIASEVLRNEIRGISQAIENSQRAINVISTAEASLNEISALILDLRGLVDHAANGGAIGTEEVKADQLEIDNLLESINRIANTTQFGGKKLLDGTLDYTTSGVSPANIDSVQVNSSRMSDGGSRNVVVDVTTSAQLAEIRYGAGAMATTSAGVTTSLQITGIYGTEQLSFGSSTATSAIVAAVNQSKDLTGVSAYLSGGLAIGLVFNSTTFGDDAFVTISAMSSQFDANLSTTTDYGQDVGATINGTAANADGLKISISTSSLNVEMNVDAVWAQTPSSGPTSFFVTGGGADFSISPTAGIAGQISIGISGVAAGSLGNSVVGYLFSLGSGQANQMSSENFTTAQRIVGEASTQIANLRGRLGALQKNQLETNINSQRVALENVQAAESAIRDADIAVEVAALTRAQILVQSTTSILGVANQIPQNVLSLLG